MIRSGSGLACLAFLLLLAAASAALGQSTTGSISGTVTDTSGAVIQGAAVSVRNVDTGAVRSSFNPRLAKRIPIGPVSVELIGEAFNVFNRSNVTGVQQKYSFANNQLARVSTFGRPCAGGLPCTAVNASTGPCTYQLAARVTF